MPAKKRSTIPGQIIAKRGILHIRLPDGVGGYIQRSTSLKDTTRNRREAEILRQQFYEQMLLPQDGFDLKRRGEAPLRLQQLLDEFLKLKNINAKSKTLYRNAITAVFGETIYYNTTTVEDAVVAYRDKIHQYSSWTFNTYLRHVIIFARWVNERYNARVDVSWIRKEMVTPKSLANPIFTEEEVQSILKATEGKDFGDLLALLSYTGCRPYDLLDLQWSHVDIDGPIPVITWRNRIRGYEEPRPVSTQARDILLRRRQQQHSKPLPWDRKNLSNLSRSFDRLLKRLGIDKAGRSLKTFRKTFKYSIRMLPFEHQMYLLRHNSPDVTLKNYTSYSIEEMATLLEKRSF